MQEKIVSYLTDKYNPQALILHGSRASGHATENSDWDIFTLAEGELDEEVGRRFGVELEVETRQLPIAANEIGERFGCRLKHARVIFDKERVGQNLLKRAKKFYEDGFNITDRERQGFRDKLRRTYYRIKERPPHIAHLYRLNFVSQAVRLWYQIIQNEWQDNFYLAFPRIKKEDGEYYQKLMFVLEGDDSNKQLKSARWIYRKLFGERLST